MSDRDRLFAIARAEYRDEHRLLCQMIMSKGVVEVSNIGNMFRKACNLVGKEKIQERLPKEHVRGLAEVLAVKLNRHLAPLGLRLCFQHDETLNDVEYLILISEIDHSETLKVSGGSFSAEQIELFHHWMSLMFNVQSETFGELLVEDALNNAKTPLTQHKTAATIMTNAQSLLDHLQREKWIGIVDENGAKYIRLGVRTLTELEPVLRSDEFDLPSCVLCKRLLALKRHAHKCQCENYVHKTCISRFLKASKDKKIKCSGRNPDGSFCTAKFSSDLTETNIQNVPEVRPSQERRNRPTTSRSRQITPATGSMDLDQENLLNLDDEAAIDRGNTRGAMSSSNQFSQDLFDDMEED